MTWSSPAATLVALLNQHRRSRTTPLSNDEKWSRVTVQLSADPARSNVAIAEELGVSPSFLSVRKELEAKRVVTVTTPSDRKSRRGEKGEGQRRTTTPRRPRNTTPALTPPPEAPKVDPPASREPSVVPQEPQLEAPKPGPELNGDADADAETAEPSQAECLRASADFRTAIELLIDVSRRGIDDEILLGEYVPTKEDFGRVLTLIHGLFHSNLLQDHWPKPLRRRKLPPIPRRRTRRRARAGRRLVIEGGRDDSKNRTAIYVPSQESAAEIYGRLSAVCEIWERAPRMVVDGVTRGTTRIDDAIDVIASMVAIAAGKAGQRKYVASNCYYDKWCDNDQRQLIALALDLVEAQPRCDRKVNAARLIEGAEELAAKLVDRFWGTIQSVARALPAFGGAL
jgi:hypothetical protein